MHSSRPRHIAVFSDVHASLQILRATLTHIDEHDIDEIWCLGDFASGGRESVAVLDSVRQRCSIVLQGNHDSHIVNHDFYDDDWRSGHHAQEARGVLDGDRLQWLKELSPSAERAELGIAMAHGSLNDPLNGRAKFGGRTGRDGRNRNWDNLEFTLKHSPQPIFLVGHTHQRLHAVMDCDGAFSQDSYIQADEPVELDVHRAVLNPGKAPAWLELGIFEDQTTATWRDASAILARETAPVTIGSTVTYRVLPSGPTTTRTIVARKATGSAAEIRSTAPIARALMGHRTGDVVRAVTPGGLIELRIERVTRVR